jgi:hypothetical protein
MIHHRVIGVFDGWFVSQPVSNDIQCKYMKMRSESLDIISHCALRRAWPTAVHQNKAALVASIKWVLMSRTERNHDLYCPFILVPLFDIVQFTALAQ